MDGDIVIGLRRLAGAVVSALLAVPVAPAAVCATTQLRILAIGDSITAGNTSTGSGTWQAELDRLLTEAGVSHVIDTEAVAGTRCDYWPSRMSSILAAHQPDMVIVDCGTNDDPAATCYGESCTSWAFRSIVEAIHSYRTPAPLIVPTLIGYSDATMAPSWLLANEPQTNDTLYGQMVKYPSSWWAGIANVQVMPGTAVYLDGDTCDPATASCGIHPNAKGYRTLGRIFYDTAQSTMGWPTATSMGEPVLCGMAGHRTGYPRPAYTPCP